MDAFGARLARDLRPGDVLSLCGSLGAGKTTLARAVLAALGHTGDVPSPTFTILETYDHLRIPIVHADFYRLEDIAELQELGLDEYREGAALLAEWPEKAGGFAHEPGCLQIELQVMPENVGGGRKAIVLPGVDWLSRWP